MADYTKVRRNALLLSRPTRWRVSDPASCDVFTGASPTGSILPNGGAASASHDRRASGTEIESAETSAVQGGRVDRAATRGRCVLPATSRGGMRYRFSALLTADPLLSTLPVPTIAGNGD